MKTYQILHEVGIKASPKAVYQALTDTKKLAGWWTSFGEMKMWIEGYVKFSKRAGFVWPKLFT